MGNFANYIYIFEVSLLGIFLLLVGCGDAQSLSPKTVLNTNTIILNEEGLNNFDVIINYTRDDWPLSKKNSEEHSTWTFNHLNLVKLDNIARNFVLNEEVNGEEEMIYYTYHSVDNACDVPENTIEIQLTWNEDHTAFTGSGVIENRFCYRSTDTVKTSFIEAEFIGTRIDTI